jgi:hypothetical protein
LGCKTEQQYAYPGGYDDVSPPAIELSPNVGDGGVRRQRLELAI